MTLRQKVENNLAIWLLSMLLAGFMAGFAAYKTILEVSGQINVSKSEYEKTKHAASRVSELEATIESLKAKEGRTPSGHRLYIAGNVVDGRPVDLLSAVKLDKTFYFSSQWLGLSSNGYYEQKWEIFDKDGLVAEDRHPFVQKTEGEYWTWARFTLRGNENLPGKYRLRVFLNGERFEDRELMVLGD